MTLFVLILAALTIVLSPLALIQLSVQRTRERLHDCTLTEVQESTR